MDQCCSQCGFHPLPCYHLSFFFVTHCRHSPRSHASVRPLTCAKTFANLHINFLICHLLDSIISSSLIAGALCAQPPRFAAIPCLLPSIANSAALSYFTSCCPVPATVGYCRKPHAHTNNQLRERAADSSFGLTANLPPGRILPVYMIAIPNAANCLT